MRAFETILAGCPGEISFKLQIRNDLKSFEEVILNMLVQPWHLWYYLDPILIKGSTGTTLSPNGWLIHLCLIYTYTTIFFYYPLNFLATAGKKTTDKSAETAIPSRDTASAIERIKAKLAGNFFKITLYIHFLFRPRL
jgi:hypothetical protein